MKIVIAAVMYSPNLGDGLIAECMGAALKTARPDAEVQWLDLAGRTEFVAPSGGLRTLVLDTLARLPKAVSLPISEFLVRRQIASRLAPQSGAILDGADLMIIGGGQLFGDANLNFPLKLAHAVSIAEARNIPFAIHGVGVSGEWSARGQALFAKTLQSPMLKYISVRDEASAQSLARHYQALGSTPPVTIDVFPDPGLRSDALEVAVPDLGPAKRKIGLGIVHPAALATHAADGSAAGKPETIAAYAGLAKILVKQGAEVHLFTNGAGEDEEMLDALWPSLESTDGVLRTPRFGTPKDLVGFMHAMDAVASHRLHACIAANSVGTTAVGFMWDKKIDAYFALTRQNAQLFPKLATTEAIVSALMRPIPEDVANGLSELKPKVQDGVLSVLEAV